ncbi:hypothetical protein N7478_001641 [Penicillium angulare]|uniref:uncharacterized protein n=1 Tax=Penicillium angulare TaxID=116970 RepID=UPI0025426015|nr:uncharacterized protein N7478_001641 [Penicillium angulare]KAJ5288611.1 hypothetical protein N7478_001641 [Penicillium angulare]
MSIHSEKIIACVNALRDVIPTNFILVGGAAANLQGHQRVTLDVDILIRDPIILHHLKKFDGFELVGGMLHYESVQIDLLTTIDDTLSYEQVNQHAEAIEAVQGVRLLKPDFALAVKVRCSYLKKEDDKGIRKRTSDLIDAVFWAERLEEAGQQMSGSCAKYSPSATIKCFS